MLEETTEENINRDMYGRRAIIEKWMQMNRGREVNQKNTHTPNKQRTHTSIGWYFHYQNLLWTFEERESYLQMLPFSRRLFELNDNHTLQTDMSGDVFVSLEFCIAWEWHLIRSNVKTITTGNFAFTTSNETFSLIPRTHRPRKPICIAVVNVWHRGRPAYFWKSKNIMHGSAAYANFNFRFDNHITINR